jgi:hypothetical protein
MADRKWFKGPAALELDRWYRSENIETNLRDALTVLQSGDSFQTIVEQLQGRRRWSSNPDFRYPRHDPLQGPEFEAITRQGYIEAIALALRHSPPVPIETFWMTGAGNERFEMHLTDGTDKVSVTVVVPTPAEGGTDEEGSPEGWVVRFNDENLVDVLRTSGQSVTAPSSTLPG